jgi:hypothetical protein
MLESSMRIQPSFNQFETKKPDAYGILEVSGWIEDDEFWAMHKNQSPELMKIKFYNQKILHMLFPKNFPDFSEAGVKFTEDGKPDFGFTIRNLVKPKEMYSKSAKEYLLKVWSFIGMESGLSLTLDLTNPTNYCKDENGNYVYLDTVDKFIKDESDVSRVLTLAERLGLKKESSEWIEVKSYAERIVELSINPHPKKWSKKIVI